MGAETDHSSSQSGIFLIGIGGVTKLYSGNNRLFQEPQVLLSLNHPALAFSKT